MGPKAIRFRIPAFDHREEDGSVSSKSSSITELPQPELQRKLPTIIITQCPSEDLADDGERLDIPIKLEDGRRGERKVSVVKKVDDGDVIRLSLPCKAGSASFPDEFASFIQVCHALMDSIWNSQHREPIKPFLDSITQKKSEHPDDQTTKKRKRRKKKLQKNFVVSKKVADAIYDNRIRYHRQSCSRDLLAIKASLDRYKVKRIPLAQREAFAYWDPGHSNEEVIDESFGETLENLAAPNTFDETNNSDLKVEAKAISQSYRARSVSQQTTVTEEYEALVGGLIVRSRMEVDQGQMVAIGKKLKIKSSLKGESSSESSETSERDTAKSDNDCHDDRDHDALEMKPLIAGIAEERLRVRHRLGGCSVMVDGHLVANLVFKQEPKKRCRCDKTEEDWIRPRTAKVRHCHLFPKRRDEEQRKLSGGLDFIKSLMLNPMEPLLSDHDPVEDLPTSGNQPPEGFPPESDRSSSYNPNFEQATNKNKKTTKNFKTKSKVSVRTESPPQAQSRNFWLDPESTQIGAADSDEDDSNVKPRDFSAKKKQQHEEKENVETPLERRALESLKTQLLAEKAQTPYDPKRLQEQEELLLSSANKKKSVNKGQSEAARVEIEEINRELGLDEAQRKQEDDEETEFWLHLPRTFSLQSSRFELPMDLSLLETLTPVDYLSRFVAVSSARRQLYDRVFVRNRSLKDGLLTDESLIKALAEVLGAVLSTEQQRRLWSSLGITLRQHIQTSFDYRQFAGVAAFSERIFAAELTTRGGGGGCSGGGGEAVTTTAEIEHADFDRLLAKLDGIDMRSAEMRQLLLTIKESGQ